MLSENSEERSKEPLTSLCFRVSMKVPQCTCMLNRGSDLRAQISLAAAITLWCAHITNGERKHDVVRMGSYLLRRRSEAGGGQRRAAPAARS
jgi:hypothetical protein